MLLPSLRCRWGGAVIRQVLGTLLANQDKRGGAGTVITEFYPERRYPLAAFECLAVKPADYPRLGGVGDRLPTAAALAAEKDADDVLPGWQDMILETAQTVRRERIGEAFLDLLKYLIAGGQLVLDDDLRGPREPAAGTTKTGSRDGEYIYLLPENTHREISKVQPLRFMTAAIGAQLKEDGLLLPGRAT